MARADWSDVLALVGGDADAALVDQITEDAHVWVENYLVGACPALHEDKLEIIERYLATGLALNATNVEGQIVESQRGDIRERYAQFKEGDGAGGQFFRMAAAFDPCGIIAEHFLGAKRAKAHVGRGYAR